jgi:hypothetical protein
VSHEIPVEQHALRVPSDAMKQAVY